ncbi:glycosyltransferase [Halorubrum sp. JWXQ-INN 858]|uniref:glycosyltransferase family 2 protein n=1 Tax=Halorubrum sp. JWXQ-INN 858 TaxID=2690782 RepID=UPI00135C14E8|nr:glycosyltransferase family 2 protein [Halorubrum sp. JWXQ-INN 858]MWV65398.1 glycosyltransferase [Halorubrum sp. JWXQ-INN 858]
MYEETTVGVVVPAYNEEGFVGEVIETLPSYVDRVYVIDDCSTDGTWAEIRRTAERVNDRDDGSGDDAGGFDRRVVPIQHDENRGVGGGIKTGYLRARRDDVGVTAVMGGDGQMDPNQLEAVIAPIVAGEADYVKGNRLLSADDREEMPGFRYVGNVILSYLTKIASGYWRIGDPQNGYTAISLAALEGVGIEEMFEFYGYCNDLLVRLSANDYRVVDVPVSARYRDEESHIDYRTYVPLVSLMLLRTFLWRLFVRRTTKAEAARSGLYVGGAIGVGMGTLTALRSRKRQGETTDAPGGDATPALADGGRLPSRVRRVPILAVGIVLLLCAMVADAAINRALNGTVE